MKNSYEIILPLMTERGIDKKKLAEIAGVYPSAVTKWAKGGAIRISQLEKIAVFFGVEVRDLMPGNVSPSVKSISDEVKYWKDRALDAEGKLQLVKKALSHALKGFEELQEAVR